MLIQIQESGCGSKRFNICFFYRSAFVILTIVYSFVILRAERGIFFYIKKIGIFDEKLKE